MTINALATQIDKLNGTGKSLLHVIDSVDGQKLIWITEDWQRCEPPQEIAAHWAALQDWMKANPPYPPMGCLRAA